MFWAYPCLVVALQAQVVMKSLIFLVIGVLLAACEGSILGSRPGEPGSGAGGGTTQVELPPFSPATLRPRLLIADQYRNSVIDLLGPEAGAAVIPPADVSVNGLAAIGAAQVSVSTTGVDQYEQNAFKAAQAGLAARRSTIVTCTASGAADSACMKQVVTALTNRAFRRTATADEITRWTTVGLAASGAYGDFDRGVEFVIAGVLQSPAFLYLDESGEPDPADATRRRLTAPQLASRLSYFLTNAPPDAALRAAAETGALATTDQLRVQARRLLADAKTQAATLRLFDELLGLDGLAHLSKDPQAFPGFQASLGDSMREETHRTISMVAFEGQNDFRDLFTTKTSFVDAALAAHYGLPAVTGWTKVTQPGRAGVLTQAGFLSLQSHPSANSPTYRGKFIRERLLCEAVAAPPANVNTTLPTPPAGQRQTLRSKLAVHMSSLACSGCHSLMDPLGFGFEGFDAIGRARTTDDTLPIDASGSFDTRGTFTDAAGLTALLHDDPRLTQCMTRAVFRQAVGHVDGQGERKPLFDAHSAFAASGFQYRELLVELVASDAFRFGRLEDAP